ncbi:MAG: hypothetical protein ABI586_01715 [Candidatus Nanopelagicales bacterium]
MYQNSGEGPIGDRSLSALLLTIALLCLVGLGVTFYAMSTKTEEAIEPVRVQVDIHALNSVEWPRRFVPVARTWGCDSGQGTMCFTTELSGTDAAKSLASALDLSRAEIDFSSPFGTRYTVCTEAGSTPVLASAYPRVSNAVMRGGSLSVPPRADPEFDGFVIFAGVSDMPCDQL